jgi:hypothetical protein
LLLGEPDFDAILQLQTGGSASDTDSSDSDEEHSTVRTEFAEVRYFAEINFLEKRHFIALGSFFGPPDSHLLDVSLGTYWSMVHLRDGDVRVFDIKSISAGVMMGPDKQAEMHFGVDNPDRYFMVEKPGLLLAERSESREYDFSFDD